MFPALAAFSVKATMILAAAALAAIAMKRTSAAARHLVWTAAVASILSLPALSLSLPRWSVPLPQADFVFRTAAVASSTESAAPVAGAIPQVMPRRAIDWRPAVAGIWSAGALLMLASMALAYFRMARQRRVAAPFPSARHSPVPVLQAGPGTMPMTFGVRRPVVFLPADAAQWSDERLQMVLLHELAHIRRADVFTQLLGRTALALCWWNPLAWYAWRQSLKDRERAADDLVLNSGARASAYAGHLLELARTLRPLPSMASAAVAIARRPQLEDRLASILASGVPRHAPARGWALTALLIAAPLAAFQAAQTEVDSVIRAAASQGSYTILDDAARAAVDERRFDEARKLLEASLDLRKDPVEKGMGLFRLGLLASRLDRKEESQSFYERAAQAWAGLPQGARAMIKLGIGATAAKDYPRAYDLFDQAKRVDPKQSAEAFLWMAVVRRAEGNAAEADAHFRSALAVQDTESADAIALGRVYSSFLREQGRETDATELDTRIARQRKLTARPAGPKSADVVRIGGDVKAPSLIQKVEPHYSEEARTARLTGTVVLFVEVHVDGKAHNVQVVQPLGLGLDDRAVEAVSQWRFRPGTRNGKPVPVAATIEVNWRLL